eukprot:Hpha_TRINITY_DN1563_c0_g1::TRINITY_DN1563_c0_g1_i1::g.57262::m.57262
MFLSPTPSPPSPRRKSGMTARSWIGTSREASALLTTGSSTEGTEPSGWFRKRLSRAFDDPLNLPESSPIPSFGENAYAFARETATQRRRALQGGRQGGRAAASREPSDVSGSGDLLAVPPRPSYRRAWIASLAHAEELLTLSEPPLRRPLCTRRMGTRPGRGGGATARAPRSSEQPLDSLEHLPSARPVRSARALRLNHARLLGEPPPLPVSVKSSEVRATLERYSRYLRPTSDWSSAPRPESRCPTPSHPTPQPATEVMVIEPVGVEVDLEQGGQPPSPKSPTKEVFDVLAMMGVPGHDLPPQDAVDEPTPEQQQRRRRSSENWAKVKSVTRMSRMLPESQKATLLMESLVPSRQEQAEAKEEARMFAGMNVKGILSKLDVTSPKGRSGSRASFAVTSPNAEATKKRARVVSPTMSPRRLSVRTTRSDRTSFTSAGLSPR